MVVAKASNRIAIKAKERTSTEINRKRNGGVVISLRIVVKGRRPGPEAATQWKWEVAKSAG